MNILDKWQCTTCGGYFKPAGYPRHRKSCHDKYKAKHGKDIYGKSVTAPKNEKKKSRPGKPFSRQVAKLRRLKAKRARTNSSI